MIPVRDITCVFLAAAIFSLASGCTHGRPVPDVSGIPVSLSVERFEQDFFSTDTLHLDAALQELNTKHPGFTQDFLFNILGSSPARAVSDVPAFIRSYTTLNKEVSRQFRDVGKMAADIKHGLQFVHHYFPKYKLPTRLITFIGPVNSFGNILTTDALAVGLQLYMGKDHPLYLSEQAQQLYPAFISRRFSPEFIPVNCMKNIVDDLYPKPGMGRPLVEQMVESGKRLYVLDRLMPETPDSIKIGYTQKQLTECYESEKNIWSFFVQNDLLYKADPDLMRDYMSDGPNTQALGPASPGNIGQFVGWQIVKKWMEKNEKTSLERLMQTNAIEIFNEAKYKPR